MNRSNSNETSTIGYLSHEQRTMPNDAVWQVARIIAVAASYGYGIVLLAADQIVGTIDWIGCILAAAVMALCIITLRFPVTAVSMQTTLLIGINAIPALSPLMLPLFPSFATALMVLSYRLSLPGIALGIAQSVIVIIIHDMLGMTGVNPSHTLDMIIAVALPAASYLGIGLHWRNDVANMRRMNRELERQREINAERQRRETIAATLHDQVTNRLAYQILRMQHDLQAWQERPAQPDQYRAEIIQLADISQELLKIVRSTIDVLSSETPINADSTGRNSFPKTDASLASPDPDTEMEMFVAHLAQSEEEMRNIGFTISTSITGNIPQNYDPMTLDIIHAGIDEFTSNMIKYADPNDACSLGITITPTDITVASSNADAASTRTHTTRSFTGGRGLSRLDRTAAAAGGTLSRERHGPIRAFHLRVPWHQLGK
ncbi:histidine kinase [Bifidobacterium callitrichos DSM 23973]|uniref:histidine kinase n=2 Tax=Bifidobacterium callitrichos TaxID=762209 RepID=A0A086ZXX7_9BIFI|nr:histidine kinase [Bifidobacterium callitrichos DSM 23973]